MYIIILQNYGISAHMTHIIYNQMIYKLALTFNYTCMYSFDLLQIKSI